MFSWADFAFPIRCNRYAPPNALGTEPRTIQPTRARLTVPFLKCTVAPIGRITTAATRSLEIAAEGVTPNSRISIGVISAPPPAPVMPTRNPMIALPRTMYGSTCIAYGGQRAGSSASRGGYRLSHSAHALAVAQ